MWEKEKMLVTRIFSFSFAVFFFPQIQVAHYLTAYHTIPTFNDLEKEAFKNIVGERRKWLPAFSPFPTMLSTFCDSNFNLFITFILSSVSVFKLDQSIIVGLGKEVKGHVNHLSVVRKTFLGYVTVS